MVTLRRPTAGWRESIRPWAERAIAPAIAAVVALVIIVPAMLPGLGYWDTGEFQTVAPVLGTAHPTGYPTYVVVGWLVNVLLTPFGDPAFRMNLFAGLSVAAAAALTVVLVRRLTDSTPIALATGIGLAATPTVWKIGTHADPHSLHLALVALVLVLLVGWELGRRDGRPNADRWLVAASFAFALSVANHSLTLLLAVPVGLYVLVVHPGIVRRPRLVATCAAALAVTVALLYLELPLRGGAIGGLTAPLVYGTPTTWDGFWYIALAEQFRGSLSDPFGDLGRKFGELAGLAQIQYGPLAPLIPVGFLATLSWHPRYALLTGLATAITCGFSAAYVNADISRYYLGPELMAWTWIGILAAVAGRGILVLAGRVSEADRPASILPSTRDLLGAVLAVALVLPTAAVVGTRAHDFDLSGDRSAERWLDAALGAVAPDAVVISWWSYSTPLWYGQHVEGRRPDIFIVDDRTMLDLDLGDANDVIARFLGKRPVYVIRAGDHDLAKVTARYELRTLSAGPATNIHEVVGPVGTARP